MHSTRKCGCCFCTPLHILSSDFRHIPAADSAGHATCHVTANGVATAASVHYCRTNVITGSCDSVQAVSLVAQAVYRAALERDQSQQSGISSAAHRHARSDASLIAFCVTAAWPGRFCNLQS